jgi:NADPH:quinone reductase-like Zn-dependent oxidoreductase
MGRQLRALALSPLVRQRLTMKVPKESQADLERLVELIGAGELTPAVDRTYPLEQAPDAMRQLEAGQVRGKLAITVAAAG